MKRHRIGALGLLLSGLWLGGCTTEQYARLLVEQDTSSGKRREMLVPSSDQLVKNKSVSAAPRYVLPDKTEIDVWVMKASGKTEPRGTVLVLHALAEGKDSYRTLARKLNDVGFDVVLLDLRAHGRSTGKHVTFGALEKLDGRQVMDNLYKDKLVAEPLYVFGAMMGGAIAVDYAAIDPRVQGVVAVAPYKDLHAYCKSWLLRNLNPLLSDEDIDKVIARAGVLAGFNPAESSTVAAAAKVHCPLLLVHGALDTIIPAENSQAIFAAAKGPKELNIVPLVGHIGVLFGRESELVKAVVKVSSGTLETASQPAAGK